MCLHVLSSRAATGTVGGSSDMGGDGCQKRHHQDRMCECGSDDRKTGYNKGKKSEEWEWGAAFV
jgi:hypothetical protein